MARRNIPPAQRSRGRFHKRAPRRRGLGFSLWLALVAGGGFAGTLAALQLFPGKPATGAEIVPIRVISSVSDDLSARFGFCHSGGGRNCVVDGDTFWFAGEKYRIADIDTPETHPARCAEEERLGQAATARLRDWLNAGDFRLESVDRDTDIHGRKLRVVSRDGASVGNMLIGEGLARRWQGARRPWC